MGCNVLAVDLPGHGRSGGEALPSVEAIADWIPTLLDRGGVGAAALVGHSLGSLAALECAARHPERVAKVALLGPAVPMPVSDVLLDAAKRDDHVAYELINGWSYSAGKQLGGNRIPGIWMTGNSLRLLERTPPGVLYTDLLACHVYVAGLDAAARIALPDARNPRRARSHGAAEERAGARCRAPRSARRDAARVWARDDGRAARRGARRAARIPLTGSGPR